MQVSTRGPPSAGLAMFVTKRLNSSHLEIRQGCCIVQAIMTLVFEMKLICVNVYVPPSLNSTQRSLYWGNLLSCVETLESLHPSAQVLIMGDMNSRVGSSRQVFYKALEVYQDSALPPDLLA